MDITNQKFIQFNSSREVYLTYRSWLCAGSKERLIALFLNHRMELQKETLLAIGDCLSVAIEPAAVLYAALKAHSSAVILLHNHPSGDPRPSRSDDKMTVTIAEAGRTSGLSLLDHLIFGHDSYFSYFDNNYLLARSHHFALQPYNWMHDLLIKNYL